MAILSEGEDLRKRRSWKQMEVMKRRKGGSVSVGGNGDSEKKAEIEVVSSSLSDSD